MSAADRILEVARGFAGLGMWEDAAAEIENLAPELRSATDVLKVRLEIYRGAGAVELAAVVEGELRKRGLL
jgi:hypothetical protein